MEKLDPSMQEFSSLLFGKVHRLEVALAILEAREHKPAALYKQAIATALGLTDREVEIHLRDFRAMGLLEPHPSPPEPSSRGRGKPPTILRTTDDHLWECLQELGNRFRRPPPSSRPR